MVDSETPFGERMVFIISPPRSGSTMLDRILAKHSDIYARPEPQLIPPLFYLGYYGTVEVAGTRDGTLAYHPDLVRAATTNIVEELPRGEEDYLDAVRAYLETLYSRLLWKAGRRLFVDKTPRNALYIDFIVKLFPKSRFVVLTRNPIAIAWSLRAVTGAGKHPGIPAAESPDEFAVRELAAFSRAVGRCMRERPVPICEVRYETFVERPTDESARVCEFLGVRFEPTMLDYGEGGPEWHGPGDPTLARERTRPTTEAVSKWLDAIAADPSQASFARQALACVSDDDLATWDFRRSDIERDIATAECGGR